MQHQLLTRSAPPAPDVTSDMMRDYGRQQYALGRRRPVGTTVAQLNAAQGWDDAQWMAEADAAEAAGDADWINQ